MKLKSFFSDTGNILAFVIGLIPTVILYVFQPDKPVSFHVFAIVFFIFLVSLWVCVKLILDIHEKNLLIQELQQKLSISQVSSTLEIIECFHDVCICKPNDLVSQNSLVTFYQKTRGYERQIGYGYVENINSANLAQIKEISHIEEISDLIQHINDHRDSIIVRSTISLNDVDKIVYR